MIKGLIDKVRHYITSATHHITPPPAPAEPIFTPLEREQLRLRDKEQVERLRKKHQRLLQRWGTKARVWDRSHLKHRDTFQTYDGQTYFVADSGAFINLTRDRRPPKLRKLERRKAREEKAAPVQEVAAV